MANFTLKAEKREGTGKEVTNKIRAEKMLPAIIYGPGSKENVNLTVDYQEFTKLFEKSGRHHLIDLTVGKETFTAVVKEFKIHPVTRRFMHVDFYATAPKVPFTTVVPVNYVGTPAGVKEGGSMFIFTHTVKVLTAPESLPDKIDVDITKLQVKQYLIVRQIEPNPTYKILANEGNVMVEIKG